jgi:hypothetical protein
VVLYSNSCSTSERECHPGGPSNPIGCVSWGTQGCIPYPTPGNPGNPGGGSGGGSGPANPGAPYTFKVNAFTTQLPNFGLQVAVLETIPFGITGSVIGGLGAAPNNPGQKPKVNWFANSNCQSAFLNSKYGPGTTSFVSHFSLLSWTPLASGPSANSSDTIMPTIATEGAKVGVGYLLKLGGAGSQTLSAWGAMTLIPGLLGTAWDAEAKNACKDVTGTNPQGW